MGRRENTSSTICNHDISDTVYFTFDRENNEQRRVDTDHLTCTCAVFDQQVILCRHIMAVLQPTQRAQDAMRSFHPSYLVSRFAAAYDRKSAELVLDDELQPTSDILPYPYYKRLGRNPRRRYRSNGEGSSGKVNQCRNCNEARGHNRATCTRHMAHSVMQRLADR